MYLVRIINKYYLLLIVFDGGYFLCIMDWFVKCINFDVFFFIYCIKCLYICLCDLYVVWGCMYLIRYL